jgi:lysophospholipase L1-like esterase
MVATIATVSVAVAACLALPAVGGARAATQGPPANGTPVSMDGVISPAGTGSATGTGSAPGTSSAPRTGFMAESSSVAGTGPFVALGDSYTAGNLLPLDLTAKPLGCGRSTKAYPVLVARALGATLTDAACGGAGVKEMGQPQQTYLGTNPAQLSELSPADQLVMFTLGGDDMGFWQTLDTCMALSFTDPWGSPCQRHYTSGGTDQLAAKVKAEAAKLTAVLTAIAALAPQARIVVVGYPDLFPQSGGCWPAVPITSGDISYLRGIETQLNAMEAADAKAAGATYVDTYTPTIGHDFCQDATTRYIEGLVPATPTLPFHPNAHGQAAIAAAVLATIHP